MSKILYIGPVRDFSGYAVAARGYIQALHDAGADMVIRPVRYDQADPGSCYKPTALERELLKRDLTDIDVVIQHITPNEMRPVEGKTNIAIVAWETTRIPEYWVERLNQFDAVMTFCNASVDAFKACGVTVPIAKVAHTFDMSTYSLDGIEPISASAAPDFLSKRFVFYNISQFSTKKGIDLLLRAYYGAFHGKGEDVVLILKTYVNMMGRSQEQAKLQQYIEAVKAGMRLPMDGYPPVLLLTKTLTDEQIKKIHATGDVYVCSSRGEGWCIPAFEALAYGNKLVTTLWGGMGEFAVPDVNSNSICKHLDANEEWVATGVRKNVYKVTYSMEPLVGQDNADPELYTAFDKVAEPSVASIMREMNEAYRDPKPEKAPDMQEFDHSVIGPKMLEWIDSVVATTKTVEEVSNV